MIDLFYAVKAFIASKTARKIAAPGVRVRLWFWERGQCICTDSEVYTRVVIPPITPGVIAER
jgi:hypothetical protein